MTQTPVVRNIIQSPSSRSDGSMQCSSRTRAKQVNIGTRSHNSQDQEILCGAGAGALL
jgi:hypothetical protein